MHFAVQSVSIVSRFPNQKASLRGIEQLLIIDHRELRKWYIKNDVIDNVHDEFDDHLS
jgi:hypothetical protein